MEQQSFASALAQKAIQQITEPAAIPNLSGVQTLPAPPASSLLMEAAAAVAASGGGTPPPLPPPLPAVQAPPDSSGVSGPSVSSGVGFVSEVRSMMFAFGDSRRPSLETAKLVEAVVRKQLVLILARAIEVSQERGAVSVGIEDVAFLLRRNPVKVQRLVKYFAVRDLVAASAAASVAASQQPGAANQVAPADAKRAKRCRDFLLAIDSEGGPLTQALNEEIPDQVRAERLRRMDRMSKDMDERRYAEFTRARQVNFLGLNARFAQKFQAWVLSGIQCAPPPGGDISAGSKIRMDRSGLEALGYLAYETVGHLVDMALLVRRDAEDAVELGSSGYDPVLRRMPPKCFNHKYPVVQVPRASSTEDDFRTPQPEQAPSADGSLACTRPLEPWHIKEALRRLSNTPRPLWWFSKPGNGHEDLIPIIAF